ESFTPTRVRDGIPECYDREDECGAGCSIESHFCKSDIKCHHEEMSAVWQRKGLIFLLKREYCNGRPRFSFACGLGFDETNCTGRYYCNTPTKNIFSIEKLLLCDGVLDCDDDSDEWESVCNETRFYCKSKQPLSVARERVENGIKDCSDGSDECPADSKKYTVFSSPFEMIGNPVFRVILWMMGGTSLLGNTAVSYQSCRSEQLNRSRQTCSILGSLAVVSTEVSALTMATMATIRLVSVYFPVRMSSIKRVTYVTPIVCAWCVGILIGILPLANYRSGYFVKYVWFPNYFFTRQEIRKTDMEWLANRVYHFSDNSSNKGWFGVKETITNAFQELPIKGEFGYFSETSVCMPRLFAKVGDASWGYSTFIIVLIFCMFVYMAGCYLILFQRSRKSKSRRLLRTVAAMILTNFCCWIPICIMAFSSLAGVKLDNIEYVVCAGVLHPLNSVLNPLIYSDHAVNFMRK
uniref:G-protein coupled receptors family 1 profile domain-containing protein n=1 Tax=Ciona savignyi TaxID=51511 RepID=H2Y6U4_CIOSA